MDTFLEIVSNLPQYIIALNGVIVALIALFMLIPGEQPEKAMQKVVDFLAKISRK